MAPTLRSPRDLSKSLIFLISLGLAPPADAQTFLGGLTEIPVPNAPEPVDVTTLARYSVDEVIRAGQALAFNHGNAEIRTFNVSINNGPRTQIAFMQNGPVVTWTPPPVNAFTQREVTVDWNVGRQSHAYTFDLTVVPAATRAFKLLETTPDGPLEHEVLVWGGGSNSLDKLLLVVEGIDGANMNNAASYFAIGAQLFTLGRNEGADIAILNFGDGGRAMQDNAAVVQRMLTDIRSYINQSPSHEVDVAGVSMGGVVARYALAEMEENNVVHGVRTFVSMDAPQQGAVVDVNLQAFIEGNVDETAWPASLARPAGLQLLKQTPFDPDYDEPSQTTDHEDFYAEMAALNDGAGYPTQTQNVGVSFGNSDPNPEQSGEWLRVDFNIPFVICISCSADFDLQDDAPITAPGSLLPRSQTQFRGREAGGIVVVESQRSREPTFIPYDSALDIQPNGSSTFDAALDAGNAGPFFHDQIPPDVVVPLLNRLGYGLGAPASVSVQGPSAASGGEEVRYRAVTPNPNATYTYAWEWRAFRNSSGSSLHNSPGFAPQTGGTVTSQYVEYGLWSSVQTTGPVFAHSFPCNVRRAEVRVTATGGGSSVTSPVKSTSICNGGAGGSFAKGGGETSKTSSSARALFSLGVARPNPAAGSVRFDIVSTEQATLTVFDALGRLVQEQSVQSGPVRLDLSLVPPGLYVARLVSSTNVVTQRFVVTR